MGGANELAIIHDLKAWAGASQRRRLAALGALKQRLRGYGGWSSFGAQRWGPGARPKKGEGVPIGVLFNNELQEGFHLIPGGELRVGLTATEIDALRRLVRDESPEAREILEHVDTIRAGRKRVRVGPMLVARLPLRATSIRKIDPSLDVDGAPAMLEPETAARVAERFGMSLPSEAEWEWACRAGTRSLFWWGDELPTPARWASTYADAKPASSNAFGLIGMGAFPEPCEGGAVRGGAAILWPWQDVGEWQLMICAQRGDADEVCLRLIKRLDELDTEPKPKPSGPPPPRFDDVREAARHAAHARALSLRDRNLRKVPATILELVELEELDLSINRLEELPDFLFELGHLRRLDISGNDLETLPPAIAKLAKLEVLTVGSTSLRRLPAALFRLRGLRELDLSWSNNLRSIPKAIAKLERLEVLRASHCRSLRFQESITKLGQLRELVLYECRIDELPESIGELRRLKFLDVGGTAIRTLPRSLAKLGELQRLSLRDCKLPRLPAVIGRLRSLRELDLFEVFAHDVASPELPKGYAKLDAVERLYLCNNRLQRWPECLTSMRALKLLNLLGNELPYDQDAIARLASLPQLEELDLGRNPRLAEHRGAIERALPGVSVTF